MFDRIGFWFSNGWYGILNLLITAFCVFFSLSVHEFFHGFAAYRLGDDTAKRMGRLNLSPFSHLDIVGAICLFFFGFGWAKPVPINPGNFSPNKRKSSLVWVSLAGPISNLIVAFLAVFIMQLLNKFLINSPSGVLNIYSVVQTLLISLVYMNIGLAVFNFIPIPPLDGSKILNSILPARIYFKIMQYEQYGFIALVLLINTPFFDRILALSQQYILLFFVNVLSFIV